MHGEKKEEPWGNKKALKLHQPNTRLFSQIQLWPHRNRELLNGLSDEPILRISYASTAKMKNNFWYLFFNILGKLKEITCSKKKLGKFIPHTSLCDKSKKEQMKFILLPCSLALLSAAPLVWCPYCICTVQTPFNNGATWKHFQAKEGTLKIFFSHSFLSLQVPSITVWSQKVTFQRQIVTILRTT